MENKSIKVLCLTLGIFGLTLAGCASEDKPSKAEIGTPRMEKPRTMGGMDNANTPPAAAAKTTATAPAAPETGASLKAD